MFNVSCILCNQEDTVTVKLEDVNCFHCTDCGEDFMAADVERLVKQWQAVLAWTDAAKTFKPL